MKEKTYQLMNWPEIEGIVYAEEDHPETILGAHPVKGGMLYQAFFPGASKVTLVLEEKEKRISMEEADEEGFFAAFVSDKKKYCYHYEVVGTDKTKKTVRDPYAFLPEINLEELKLYQNGIHYELHRLLGSHKESVGGVEGVQFTVWMPHAVRVSIVGEFNGFDGRVYPMCRVADSDLFTLFLPDFSEDTAYQYEAALKGNRIVTLPDPFADGVACGDRKASVMHKDSVSSGKKEDYFTPSGKEVNELFLYRIREEELPHTDELAEKLSRLGYTHAVLPLADPGENYYQLGYGCENNGLVAKLSKKLQQTGIGLLLNWEVSGLGNLWIREVSNYHIAKVLYLIEHYGLDGVVFSGMACLFYLDYGKEAGQWTPNIYGGNENLDAVEWIKHTNSILKRKNEDLLLVADMDAIWPDVTLPLHEGGLGFDYRYDRDFTRDFLEYLKCDPYFRSGIQEKITDRMLYAYRERFIMSFGAPDTKQLWESIVGNEEDRFRTLKLAHSYLMFLPGKVLSSMEVPEVYTTEYEKLVKDCSRMNHDIAALGREDFQWDNFRWINCFQYNECIVSFCRLLREEEGSLLMIANFANVSRTAFRVGVPYEGKYRLTFHSENASYGGQRKEEELLIYSEDIEWDGYPHSIEVELAPLSLAAFAFLSYTEEELFEIAKQRAEEIRLKLEEEARNKAARLKKNTLKDTLSRQVEASDKAISEGSESKKKMERKRRSNGRN